jgi:sulfide dehydrogenase cytochrome subunit
MRLVCASIVLGLVVMPAAAAQPPPGAATCSGCHGTEIGAVPPPIHGRPATQIVELMRAFRTGERPATVMDRLAKGFTEEETRAIADWLSRAPKGRR